MDKEMSEREAFEAWWKSEGFKYDPEAQEWVARVAWKAACKWQRERDAEICALIEIRDQREEREKRLGVAEEAENLVKAAWVDRKYKGLVGWHVSLLPPDGTQLYMLVAAPKPETKSDMNICSVCGIDRRQEACKGNPFSCPQS